MKLRRISVVFAAGLMLVPLVVSTAAEPSAASEGDATEPDAGAGVMVSAPFDGIPWKLVAYRSGDALSELKEGRGPALFRFDGGTISGSAGCNRLLGVYKLNGDRLGFERHVSSTMMACAEPLMAQEQAVGAALAAVVSYRLDAKRLELLDAAGEPLLRFDAREPSPLTDQIWGLVGYSDGKHAIVSVLEDTEITLELRDDGTLGGTDGCNRYMSGYTLEGEKLSIGPLATTRVACRGPQGAAEQAVAYARALERVAGYRIEGSELTLLTDTGKRAARFRALPAPAAVQLDRAESAAAGQDAGRP